MSLHSALSMAFRHRKRSDDDKLLMIIFKKSYLTQLGENRNSSFILHILVCALVFLQCILSTYSTVKTGSTGVTTSHLNISVTICVTACVRVCANHMFCISLPLEGSFSGRYTITLTGVLICKRGQDKCTCHSRPHGISSSHARGREIINSRVVTVEST